MTNPAPRPAPAGLQLALDYLPLVVFFAVNFLVPAELARRSVAEFTHSLAAMTRVEALLIARVIVATAAFVIATAIALIWSYVALKRISPMLLISGVLVLVFGGLTIWFHDARFIQMKPSIVYAMLAAILGFGLATGRPLLEQLLGAVYPGLSDAGWRRLTINWAAFFAVLAIANEIARRLLTYDQWVLFKFPLCTVVTVFFALGQVPMLMRHGLRLDDGTAAADQLPPE